MPADDRVANLVNWATSHGATLHPSIEVVQDPTTGLSLRVRPDGSHVEPGDAIVSCPMGLTLSYLNLISLPASHGFRTCSGAEPRSGGNHVDFPDTFVRDAPPHVLSRFLLMREFALGEESFWAPYIGALPQPGSMDLTPPFWPDDDRELLEATSAGITAEEIRTRSRKEYNDAIELLRGSDESVGWRESFPEERYQWAHAIYSTRNFKPATVVTDPDGLRNDLPEGVSMADFSILMPLFDIGNHSPTAKVAWEASTETAACALVTRTEYQPGDQVFNNYDPKSNAELLVSYGFVLPSTPSFHNDYIHLIKKATQSPETSPRQERPVDLLISLRPIDDPSSVLGLSRRMVDRQALPLPVQSSFRHVEDAMVWGIVSMLTTLEERETVFFKTKLIEETMPDVPRATEEDLEKARLRMFLMGLVQGGEDGIELFEKTISIIQDKLMIELEKLLEVRVGDSDSDDEDDENDQEAVAQIYQEAEVSARRRRLALWYRRKHRKILETALESINEALHSEDEDGDAE